MRKPYTDEEVEQIRSFYPDFGKLMELIPHRGRQALWKKAREIGVTRSRAKWTASEDNLLRKHHPDIAAILMLLPTRTRNSVLHRAHKMGITRSARPWTAEQLEVLTKISGKISDREAAAIFGRSVHSVALRRNKLGLQNPVRPRLIQARLPLVQDIIDEAKARNIQLGKVTNALGCCQKLRPSVAQLSIPSVLRVVKALGGELYAEWDD